MKNLSYIFLLFLFFSCQKDEKHKYPRVIVPKAKNVVEVNTNYMLRMTSDENGILALNFDKDTILGDKKDFHQYDKYIVNFKNWDTVLPRYNFKIIIDTSYTISANGFVHKNLKLPNTKEEKKSNSEVSNYFNNLFGQLKDYVICYPLLIFNSDNKPAYIWDYKFIQEAKDIDGKWKPIEYFNNTPTCVVVTELLKIKPSNYLTIPIIKYNGSFKTKIRVKIKIDRQFYYSNEINGFINRTQFDKSIAKKSLSFWKPNWDDKFFDEYLTKTIFLEE